jgi:hypothetical protein
MLRVRASPPRSMRRTSWRTDVFDKAISPTPWMYRAGRVEGEACVPPMPLSAQLAGSSYRTVRNLQRDLKRG